MEQTAEAVSKLNPASLGIIFGGIILIVILILIFGPQFIKKIGLKKISKQGLELNTEQIQSIKDKTQVYVHEIQRKQLNFVEGYIKDFRNNLNNYIEAKGYRYSDFNIPYVAELMFDEVVNWIVFNNIEDANDYIMLHEDQLWLVYKNAIWSSCRGTDNIPIHYKGKEIDRKECDIAWDSGYFKGLISKATRDIVTSLVKIKIMHNSYANTIQ